MDNADKRYKDTIEHMGNKDLYSLGNAQRLNVDAQKNARKLQKEAKKKNNGNTSGDIK